MSDYQPALNGGRSPRRRSWSTRWAIFGTVTALVLGGFSLTSLDANALKVKEIAIDIPGHEPPVMLQAPLLIPQPKVVQASIEELPVEPDTSGTWHQLTVKSGDSLARIFSRQGLKSVQLHDILSSGGVAKKLTRIYPGQKLHIKTDPQLGLVELSYEIDALTRLNVLKTATGYESSLVERSPERRVVSTTGHIENSLFLAAQKAGLPENITMDLAGIFGWDVDFVLDIRRGDKFTLLYEDLYLDGERIGTGNILAAEFINQDKVYQAVRYTDAQDRTDYYTPEGHSMRKSFLRTPVSFTRISSRFSLGRKHPILNRIRAHKGVDYAASRGTPVKATGTGKILHKGKKGGYGNTIVVQHGSRYSTLYAHLSRYAPGIKNGSRIQQGQIIGYVGSSGLATGPHLHYEFRVNGVHRNPLSVKFPDAAPLPRKFQQDFSQFSETLLSQLETTKKQAVALSD